MPRTKLFWTATRWRTSALFAWPPWTTWGHRPWGHVLTSYSRQCTVFPGQSRWEQNLTTLERCQFRTPTGCLTVTIARFLGYITCKHRNIEFVPRIQPVTVVHVHVHVHVCEHENYTILSKIDWIFSATAPLTPSLDLPWRKRALCEHCQ